MSMDYAKKQGEEDGRKIGIEQINACDCIKKITWAIILIIIHKKENAKCQIII